MIAANRFSDSVRGMGRNALDLPVAALAGLAVAVISFAIPADLLAELVGSTGLPSLLPAAEPPLGLKARIGVGAFGAVAVFAAVFLLLRLLDRSAGDRLRSEADGEEAPRVRRRDFHPDAPAPRPISVARDLGEPDWGQADETPLWLSPAQAAPEDTVEPIEELEAPEPEACEVAAEPDPVPSLEPEPRPGQEPQSSTLAELMERLEQGLARRRQGQDMKVPESAPREVAVPAPATDEPVDERLQNAIDSLQRLAARQG